LIKFISKLIKNYSFSIVLVAFFFLNISSLAKENYSTEILEIEKPRSFERFILASNTEKIIEFRLAFFVRNYPESRNKFINIAEELREPGKNRATVREGDKVSLYVQPYENSYVYIFLLNSSNDLNLLFPTNLNTETIKNEFYSGKGTYIPGKFEWFTFDENKGIEKFYLLALSERDEELEKLTRIYLSSDSDKEIAKQNVLNRIKEIKREFAFANKPDWPVPYAGTIERESEFANKPDWAVPYMDFKFDIAKSAIEIKTNTFYTRTIQFDHE